MNKLKRYLTLFSITLFILIPVLFSACSMPSSSDSNTSGEPAKTTAKVELPTKADPDSTPSTIVASLKASTFVDSTQYSSDLAISSLCVTVASEKENELKEFFTDFEFDNIVTKNSTAGKTYDDNTTMDSISYGLAHYKDIDYDVVVVAVRSANYGAEWGSNFDLGESGDHAGFSSAAKMVYTGLKNYIDTNYAQAYANKTLKIWISGYSRGAAVSDVLAYYILTGLENDSTYVKLDIDAKSVFVYTFATPRSLCAAHKVEYSNVFNHISTADIVTYVAPEAWGFYRCGKEIVLFDCDRSKYKEQKVLDHKFGDCDSYKVSYTSVLDEWLKAFNATIELPVFCKHTRYEYPNGSNKPSYPGDTYKTEKECIEYLLGELLKVDGSRPGMKFNTRENFVSSAQPTIQYLMNLYINNQDKFPTLIQTAKSDVLSLMGLLLSADNCYTTIKGLFDKVGISYDATTLKQHTDIIFNSINPSGENKGSLSEILISKLLPGVMGGNTDLQRIIKMHYPEVTCVTLLKYLGV